MRVLALLLALTTAFFFGCDSEGPLVNDSGVGDLALVLDVEPMTGNLILYVQTVEEYGCANQHLIVVSDVGAERVTASVEGVSEAADCFPVLSPASWVAQLPYGLDDPEAEGYRVEIEKDGDTDVYVFDRSRGYLDLREVEASFSSILRVRTQG